MTNSFLPEGYTVPKSDSPFMKFDKGDNTIRLLEKPLMGYLGWKEEKDETGAEISVPYRFDMDNKPADPTEFKNDSVKHFWAMPVWSYENNAVKVLEITQKGIQKELFALATDEDWGSPAGYDIKITKEGDGLETEYTVTPKPKKVLDAEIEIAWNNIEKKGFNIENLMENKSPFAQEEEAK